MRSAIRRGQAGVVLPFVLLSLLLVAALASATALASWRAVRGARLAFNGERALQGADEALALALSTWDASAFAARPIGARWQRTITTSDAGTATLSFARTAPLASVVSARMRSLVRGAPDTASRQVTRYLVLETPAFPARAAVVTLGPAALDSAANVNGLDIGWASDGCGAGRDTLSVPGVHSMGVVMHSAAVIAGAPPVSPGPLVAASLATDRSAFATAWSSALARVTRTDAILPAAALPPAPAWSARRLVSADSSIAPPTVTLGTGTHTGLLLVDGDLEVIGTLDVEGLLVVRGRIDARAGTLVVSGALLVRDDRDAGSTLGSASRVRYSPCSVARALATIARPRVAPFSAWIER